MELSRLEKIRQIDRYLFEANNKDCGLAQGKSCEFLGNLEYEYAGSFVA